jgi:RimJ/RimL family protein N-acetyltransferase
VVHPDVVVENGVLRLRDGRECSVRPLVSEDREALRAAIERQSPESQYRRFFTTFAHGVPDKIMNGLIDPVDGVNHIALVLLAPDRSPIGVGRLVRHQHDPDSAEISFAVDDQWHGTGAGSALGIALAREARRQGIDYLTASVRVHNDAALAVLASLGVVRSRQVAEPGVYDLEVFLEGTDRPDGAPRESPAGDIPAGGSSAGESPDGGEHPGGFAFAEAASDKVVNALAWDR